MVQARFRISQTLKVKTLISLNNTEQVWDIPKTKKIYLWGAHMCKITKDIPGIS